MDRHPKPPWLRITLKDTAGVAEVRRALRERGLHTVCEEARCPNLHECWNRKSATFMVLGEFCTRRCGFCAVKSGRPRAPDLMEPARVADSVVKLGIVHAVITMVTRDDLQDGGATHLAAVGRAVKERNPAVRVEYLSSDMMGRQESVAELLDSRPDILGHNLETVRRLTPGLRSPGDYDRSLEFLKTARRMNPSILLKSSLMLGLGETRDEVLGALGDLRDVGCDSVNLGQYLQPTVNHRPVERYWTPEEFAALAESAKKMAFRHVNAGPLVRSSYHAGRQWKEFF